MSKSGMSRMTFKNTLKLISSSMKSVCAICLDWLSKFLLLSVIMVSIMMTTGKPGGKYSQRIICKSITYGISAVIHNQVDEKDKYYF